MSEVGVAFVRLLPSMRGFSGEASRQLNSGLAGPAEAAGKKAGGSFVTGLGAGLTSAGKKISGFGDKMTVGLTLPLVLFGKRALDAALTARTATRQMNLVFEDSAGQIRSFAKQNAASFGLTERAMQGALAGFGGLGLSIGFTSKETAGMTGQAGELAAALTNARPDLGSFDQVMEALSGGITENREEMKRWGINVSDADIKARLASKGLEGLEGNALKQARAQAFLDLAVEGSALSLKDFRENGVDPTIKAQNEMKAEAAKASEEFGKNLTPIVTDVSKVLGGLLERFNNLSPGMKAVATRAAIVVAALGPVLSITGRLTKGLGRTIQAAGRFSAGLRGLKTQGVSGKLGQLTRGLANLTAAAVRATGRVIASFATMAARAVAATARVAAQIAIQIARWVALGVQSLLAAAKVALAWLISLGPIALVIATVVAAAALIIANWDKIKRFVTRAAKAVVGFLKRNWPKILAILTGPIGIAVLLIVKNWDKIKRIFSTAISAVVGFMRRLPGRVVQGTRLLGKNLVNLARGAWNKFFNKAKEIGRNVIDWVKRLPGRILRALGNLGSLLIESGKDIIRGLIDGIKNMIPSVGDALGGIKDSIPSWVDGPLGIFSPSKFMAIRGEALAAGMAAGIEKGLGDVEAAASMLVQSSIPASAAVTTTPAPAATITLDVTGGTDDLVRLVQKWVRTRGGGNVQVLAGAR